MADSWRCNGMRAPWLQCWILLLKVVGMMQKEIPSALVTQVTPRDVVQPNLKNLLSKNISIHEIIGRHGGRVYPHLTKDMTTRLPEFLPDGPRPFVPEPSFMPGSTDVVAHQSEVAVLPCTVQNLGARQVSWNKQGGEHFLSIGTEIWVQDSNLDIAHYSWPAGVSDWNLVFKEVRMEDSGLYECQVISTEKMTWRVRLNVIEKPSHKPVISIEGKEFVESGQKVYLKCNTTEGDKIPEDLDWFKDGDKIEANEYPHIFITKYRSKDTMALVSELTITSGTSNDSGTYICRSTSELIASAEVSVLVADSSNVKRGTGISRAEAGSGRNHGNSVTCHRFPVRKNVLGGIILIVTFLTTIINT